ncbi:alpha/beta-hydrolase, partial [Tilletiaria anomala UBC 951]
WLPQVEYFASKPDEYSVLIFDQRGYGNSQVPRGRYTTSQMALDILSLLAETDIAPADARAFHIVGVSMGGMIALELAKRYAPLLKSLTLISTTSGRAYGAADRFATGLPPLRGVSAIARVMGGRLLGIDSDAFRIKKFTTLLFPAQWLDEPCERLPHAARVPSNRQWFAETFQWRYRYTHRQALPGALAQIAATLTHRVSNAELRHNIDAHVPRTLVLTGDDDNLVNPDNSRHLLANMPRARLVRLTGGGHALNMQFPARVNRLIEENVNEGEDLVAQGGW